jgi:hypothetical protein|tara:strand:+ start:1687 stop:2103 length:417 start_codon:yes stop_codon:yes gene_type:complete
MNHPKCGIVIHNIEHARAALRASSATKIPIAVISAPYAGCYAGVSWFLKIEEKVRKEFSKSKAIFILDCGDEPGIALEAFRLGVKFIFLKGSKKIIKKVSEIGAKKKSALYQKKIQILDLKNKISFLEQCEIWLSRKN